MKTTAIESDLAGRVASQPWHVLDELASTVGASFYLVDLRHFETTYLRFLNAFQSIYPKTSIGYSYKTNYLPDLALRADTLGAYAEVVSRFELDFAEALGIDGKRILFNGPVKRDEDIAHAVAVGARINVDSVHELYQVARLASTAASTISVGIRCFLGAVTPGSRFGVDLTSAEAAAAIQHCDSISNLRLAGLHCHYCGDRGASGYRARLRAMIRLHRTTLSGRPLDYLDIGGGFASNMAAELAAQLPAPPSTFEDYGDAIASEMLQSYGAEGPELIVEPGMGILADAAVFVTRVEVLKELGERRIAVVNGSVFNIKPLRGPINLPVHAVPAPNSRPLEGPRDIVGHTCMEVDLMHSGYQPALGVGDFVVVGNVGAYTNVLNAPFIRGTPAIVEFGSDGAGAVLRRPSTTRDLLLSYEDDK